MKKKNESPFSNSISPREEMRAFEALWAMDGMTEKKMASIFQKKILPSKALQNEKGLLDLELIEEVNEYLNKIDTSFSIAVFGDFQYPEKLRHAQYPIQLFYYKGDLELINTKCVSIVGARNSSPEGLRRAA